MKRWIHASEDAEWEDIINQLQEDCEIYTDPIYMKGQTQVMKLA